MGVQQRVVQQTITEVICDYCKKPVAENVARTGLVSTRTKGQRGRAAEAHVAFHPGCLAKITDTAAKPRRAPRKSPAKKAAPKAAKKATRRGKTAKPARAKRTAKSS